MSCAPPAAPPVEVIAHPSAGIDLPEHLASPAKPQEAKTAEVQVRELGSDLRPAKLAVPNIPVGTNASFDAGSVHGWVTRLPHGTPIPTAAYGNHRVYVGSGFTSRSFYALDSETGRVEWAHHELGDDGPTAPAFDDDRVVFNTESCTLFVLDAKTGRTLWSKYLGDPTLSQPAVADGVVYAAFPDRGFPKMGAFRAKDGEVLWKQAIDGELLSAPAVAGDSIYLTTLPGTTYRLARESGDLLWRARQHGSSAPWVLGGEVYESRVNWKQHREEQIVLGARSGELLRVLRGAEANYLGDVPRAMGDSQQIWAFEGSRPVLAGGRRFDTMGGEIQASDPRTGAPLWRRRHAASAGKRGLTPPAVAGAKVVFASYEGELYVLDADTGLTVFAYRLGVPLRAQPIVARGWIYLTTATGSVIGLALGDASLDGWHMWGGGAARNG